MKRVQRTLTRRTLLGGGRQDDSGIGDAAVPYPCGLSFEKSSNRSLDTETKTRCRMAFACSAVR